MIQNETFRLCAQRIAISLLDVKKMLHKFNQGEHVRVFAKLIAIVAIAFATLLATSTSSAAPAGRSELTGSLGMSNGAANFGAQFDKGGNGPDMGGYFMYQSSKERGGVPFVYQVMSFGAQMKMHIVSNNQTDVYLAPGVGLHMIKDAPDNGKKTDVTAFGPTLRIGTLVPLTSTVKIGLERMEIVNWFDDKAPASFAVYSAALAMTF